MRISTLLTASLLFLGAAGAASGQSSDFSGRWSSSGQIVASPSRFMAFAQICDLKQTGDQVAGTCRGPTAAARWSAWFPAARSI
jgi:hypothetical protein